MAKSLLIEYSVFTPKKSQITEGVTGSKNMVVEGVVQRAEEFNHNGRTYPYEVLKKEVDKYIEGPIAENRALGELDHPESAVINLKNASHNIKQLWWDGNDLMGKIEVLPTPSGNILRELFNNAIHYADNGFPITEVVGYYLPLSSERYKDYPNLKMYGCRMAKLLKKAMFSSIKI